MDDVQEFVAMKAIDDELSKISDSSTRDRILKWAWSKFSPTPLVTPIDAVSTNVKKAKKSAKKSTKGGKSYTTLKDLNLNPSGKKSFNDFVGEKQPSSHQEKCAIAVYYIANILKQAPVSADHVYTCFKFQKWRLPSNLHNMLQVTASQKAWLDTANMTDIKITSPGYNLIEHDLPMKK